jgi:hypothetical protein
MPHRSLFICCISLLLLFPLSARAQEPSTAVTDERAALEKKANDLLLSVAGQIGSLRSAENRARIGSNAAEALWKYDEKRARTLFAAVAEDVKAGFTDADPDLEAYNHTLLVFWQLRSDTIARIARHDPELALEFLRATRRPTDEKLPYGTMDTENSLELRLAGQVAAKNPELALKLGQESLAKGFSGELLETLKTLQSTDKSASVTFYQAIIDKLKTEDLGENLEATRFGFLLANQFAPPQADERVFKELLGLLLAAALAKDCGKDDAEGSEICYQIGAIFPKVEKYFGPRAAALKRWDQEGEESNMQEAGAYWTQVRELAEKGTVDEILAFVEKNPESKYELYWAALKKAESSGEFEKARKIAGEFPESEQRAGMIAAIDLAEKRVLTHPDNPDSVQRVLSTFRSDQERIEFLLTAAVRVATNDRKAALQILNQARPIVDSSRGKTQLEGQIALALLYCSLKSNHGFEIVESLIPKLNQLVTAAAALDGIENNYLRDEEWNMTGAGELGGLLTVLAQNAGWFGRMDFDRAVSIANQLERPELRMMTELKIAQGVLEEPPSIQMQFQSPYSKEIID